MAESNQISRKRMRFSSPSATEILTKRKSQNQRLATAVSQTGNQSRLHHPQSLIGKINSKIIRTYPRVTIKDLRLRRVFSPSSISIDNEFKTNGKNQTKDSHSSNFDNYGIKANVGGLGNVEVEDLLQTTPPDSELLSNVPIREEINGGGMEKIDTNLCSKSVLHPCSRAKIFKNPGSFSYKRLLPYLMLAADDGLSSSSRCSKPEKSFGQNLPSINLSCNKEIGETAEEPKEEVSELITVKCQLPETTKPVLQSVDRVFDKDSAGSFCRSTSPLKRVIASSPNKKAACSRRKLFKTPGSVNYRRMLPYLRDIQEDNPCVPETVSHPDPQKNTEENTPSSMLVSENEGTQQITSSNLGRESDTNSNENKEPLSCERVSVSPERSDLDKEQETQVKHVILDTEKNSGTPLASEILLSSPLVDSRSSSEVASSSTKAGEALNRACEATELAKSRLHQMNDDLQVHCRIPNEQRARVKFAHYIHEKTMNLTS